MRRIPVLLVAASLLGAAAPSAQAGTLLFNGGADKLRFDAADGEANRLTVTQGDIATAGKAADAAYVFTDAGAPITLADEVKGACSATGASEVTCSLPPIYRLQINLADGDDTAKVGVDARTDLGGGDGNDLLETTFGPTELTGGAGDDRLISGRAADILSGGDGSDTADFSARTAPVAVTPGTGADDGAAGEGDDVNADVETVLGGEASDVLTATPTGGTLEGNGGDDQLTGGPGDDRMNGGGGVDTYAGDGGNDGFLTRDGAVEQIACGAGADTVVGDFDDNAFDDCEVVQSPLAEAPGAPLALPTESTPAPLFGRGIGAAVSGGTVLIRPPGSRTFLRLRRPAYVPFGSVLDTRRGTLSVTAARDRSGATQTANFSGARFVVRQVGAKQAITELELTGGAFSRCTPKGARTSAKGPRRRLWGSGKGRFRTRGRTAAATVRGTVWSVEDTCGGTRTTVERGVVDVRDLVRHRTVTVTAGRSYLARARTR